MLNTAEEYGGTFYLANTDITFGNIANFTSNAAMFGGALYFDSSATMTLVPHTIHTTNDILLKNALMASPHRAIYYSQ